MSSSFNQRKKNKDENWLSSELGARHVTIGYIPFFLSSIDKRKDTGPEFSDLTDTIYDGIIIMCIVEYLHQHYDIVIA